MALTKYKGKTKYRWMENHVKLKWITAHMGTSPYSDSVYIDTAQCLSLLNRKLVRQGQIFRIRNMKFFTNDTSPNSTIKVGVIPRNWVSRNAWVKGKALWDELNATAAADVGASSIYPKWHDFKVHMDYNHYTEISDGSIADANLLPVDFDDDAITAGEWEYAKFSDSGSSSDDYFVGMLDDHSGSSGAWGYVGMIQAYGESRTYPQADATQSDELIPATLATSPWARLFGDDDQTSKVITDLSNKNDSPPYSRANYIGGSDFDDGTCVGFTRVQSLSNVTGTGIFGVSSFDAPCGLIRIEWDAEEDAGNDPPTNPQPMHIQFDVDILCAMDA